MFLIIYVPQTLALWASTHTHSKVSFSKVSKSKFSPKLSKWLFLRISENDTFECAIIESVKIESVGVDAHCQYPWPFMMI